MAIVPNIPNNYANARFRFSCTGVDHVAGFSIGLTAGIDLPAFPAQAVALAFIENVLDGGDGMGSAWTFEGVHLTQSHEPDPPTVDEHNTAVHGTLSPDSIPPNCSMLVQKKTAFGGRHYRGRAFVPPAMLFDVDIDAAGNIDGATRSAHQGLWNSFFGALVDLNMDPVLFHYEEEGFVGPLIPPTPLTTFVVASKLATQRRRLR